jgi:hypothetical protein
MTKQIKTVIYGLGGYDETKPDNNIVSYEYYSKEELDVIAAETQKAADKAALLAQLGITEEQAKLLLE